MELLKIQNIEKYYGTRSSLTKAIDDISFTVDKGEFVAIMGASGSGKTTLLNCISTIDTVTAGRIFLEGTDVTKLKGENLNKFRRDKLGFIFQDFNLLRRRSPQHQRGCGESLPPARDNRGAGQVSVSDVGRTETESCVGEGYHNRSEHRAC